MAILWYRFRAEARQGWKAWLALGILVGLGSGAVLVLVAGARRTDSAIDRFGARANPWHVQVVSGIPGLFDFAELDLEQVAALPGVADSVPVFGMAVEGVTADGTNVSSESVNFVVDPAGRIGADVDRVKMLEGRRPHPDDPTEVMVSFRVAEDTGLKVGETISATFLSLDTLTGTDEPSAPPPTSEELRVVGVYATVRELARTFAEGVPTDVRLTPAAFERHRPAAFIRALDVVLAEGADGEAAFLERVEALSGGVPVFALSQPDSVRAGQDAVRPVSRALVIGSLLVGIVVLVLGGQALARQASSEAVDDFTLVTLGFTGGRLVGVRALKAAAVGVAAAITAVAVAVLAAPLFPIGLAALIEPDPGWQVDGPVLALGGPAVALALAALGTAVGSWSIRRAVGSERGPGPRRPQAGLVNALSGAGARPPVLAGVLAASGGGTDRAPWASVFTIALGVLATIGATSFGASLEHLTSTPALYGWNWDVRLGQAFSTGVGAEQLASLRQDPALAALAVGSEAEVDLGSRRLAMLGFENEVGDIEPSLISGRAARDLGEVAVAPGVAALGERLTAGFGDTRTELRVVGVAAIPDAGAMVTLDTLRRLVPGASTHLVLARVADPAELGPFIDRASVLLQLGPGDDARPELNEEVANFGRVEHLPGILAILMGLVAMGTLLHALLLSVGRRRRELAVLKVLGFTRGQVLATVAAQASTLAVLAVALGLPLGIAAGRALWLRFADGLGVVPVAVVPLLATGFVVALAMGIANLAAMVPGSKAARTPAAEVLRSE